VSDDRRAWIRKGSVVMALVAAIALGATVLVAQRALSDASDVVMRGEADALVSVIVADAAQEGTPPTAAWLQEELGAHADRGLRYVAVMQRDALIEAGVATMPDVRLHPGESRILERRVRVVGFLPGPHPPFSGGGSPGQGGPRPHLGPMMLVVELEPPIIEQLRAHLTRIAIVATGAAAVLVGFAFALSRAGVRLAAIEQRAAREQRLVALGSMSSVMAHELRNPLASLKGHAQLLAEDLEHDEKAKKKADRVVTEAQRIEDLTTSLLDFVRDGPIERTTSTPAALAERALADLPRDRVDVRIDEAAEAGPPMTIDEPRLARAVHNLVDNALKAAEDDSRIELAIGRDRAGGQEHVVITVRDHGPGIADGAQMFEPFVTTRVRGTGLGLPVARRIAEQHGGTLIGESHPDGGAIFTLRFPA
jgi:two-component system sensor histidine kinase HydH